MKTLINKLKIFIALGLASSLLGLFLTISLLIFPYMLLINADVEFSFFNEYFYTLLIFGTVVFFMHLSNKYKLFETYSETQGSSPKTVKPNN